VSISGVLDGELPFAAAFELFIEDGVVITRAEQIHCKTAASLYKNWKRCKKHACDGR
jgi:hypothetical protein